jgi:hypothetical protein
MFNNIDLNATLSAVRRSSLKLSANSQIYNSDMAATNTIDSLNSRNQMLPRGTLALNITISAKGILDLILSTSLSSIREDNQEFILVSRIASMEMTP